MVLLALDPDPLVDAIGVVALVQESSRQVVFYQIIHLLFTAS
jgi:hypothetical protein